MRLQSFILMHLTLLALPLSGCGLLLGNVKPVEEKSEAYRILDLSRDNADWKRMDPAKPGSTDSASERSAGDSSEPQTKDDRASTDVSDMAFQSVSSASIVSLNSACRPSQETAEKSLQEFTRILLLGISDVTLRDERNLTVAGVPALETTVEGKLQKEAIKLRTVVLRKEECVYDLMYIARPDHFEKQLVDFERFVGSLRLGK